MSAETRQQLAIQLFVPLALNQDMKAMEARILHAARDYGTPDPDGVTWDARPAEVGDLVEVVGRVWMIPKHDYQEYNEHGNTCHYPGCRLSVEDHRGRP